MRNYIKSYFRCPDDNITNTIVGVMGIEVTSVESLFTFNGMVTGSGYVTPPTWFDQVNGFPITDTYWTIEPNAPSAGVYYFSYTGGTTGTEYIIKFEKVATCQSAINVSNCKNSQTLVWLNREGGWSSFVFTGVSSYDVEIPEGSSYAQSDFVKRYQSRTGVYNGQTVTTGSTPQYTLDLLESLKYSAQAYLVETKDLSEVWTPIWIPEDSFTKRKSNDKRFDVTVRFIYAKEVQIQTG